MPYADGVGASADPRYSVHAELGYDAYVGSPGAYDAYGHPLMARSGSTARDMGSPYGPPPSLPLSEQHDYQMLTIPPSRIAIAPLLSHTNLYIKGLSPDTTDASLFALCSRYGTVVSAKAVRSIHTLGSEVIEGPCRGYGFALVCVSFCSFCLSFC